MDFVKEFLTDTIYNVDIVWCVDNNCYGVGHLTENGPLGTGDTIQEAIEDYAKHTQHLSLIHI